MCQLKNMVLWGTSLTTEHQEALNEVSTTLFVYVDNIFLIKSIYDTIGDNNISGIASPYLNFRDALFHYRKMYEAADKGENVTLIQQRACIDEHLNRGIRDFAINLCSNYFVPVINELMTNKANYITDIIFQRLRHAYHELKGIVAEIRLGGQQLIRFGNNDEKWLPKMIEAIQGFDNLLVENPLVKSLYEIKKKNINFYTFAPNKPTNNF
jgi:hypothetical protein